MAEDLPEDVNRADLDPDVTDSNGIPAARVTFVMGTAPTGRSPTTSVVSAWHQTHQVPNLFVVDGSSFTTSGGVNPTSTIGALATRGRWQLESPPGLAPKFSQPRT